MKTTCGCQLMCPMHAAAPVMLEALKVALELLKASELDMLEKYDDLAFNAVHDGRNQVEIAIAQAEGERETNHG